MKGTTTLGWVVIAGLAAVAQPRIVTAQQIQTCGLSGTLAVRINECAAVFGSQLTTRKMEPLPATGEFSDLDQPTVLQWSLVTRTVSKHLVWRDEATGLLWVFMGNFKLYTLAERACERFSIGLDIAWKIPEKSSLEVARQHKVFDVLNQPGEYLTHVSQTSPERNLISYTPAKYAACAGR
ncbi:MAG: hypothetical protein E4H37_00920 [Gemmatimonadales bacterium]|nr:MAG: hypothetical protein E4H37_00865 [Gemmatimonadales bacterium]TFG54230.1 MAG: hypothetical protein E4H37_00920 [Gemmatimonadales bacterium]